MKAAKTGEEILINAETLRVGKTMAFLDVDIINKETGDLVAKGSHTKFIGWSLNVCQKMFVLTSVHDIVNKTNMCCYSKCYLVYIIS